MSLQVWAPLNRDTQNIGANSLSSISIASGINIESNGKIGKCYTNTGTNAPIGNSCIIDSTSFSACAWVKINTQRKGWQRVLGMSGSNTYFGLGCEHTNGTSLGFHFYKTYNGTNTSIFDVYPVSIKIGTWVHYAMCYDGKKYYIYENGVQVSNGNVSKQDAPVNMTQLFLFGGHASGYSQCSLNDVRIYDHCLSSAGVREIAQGLVLHYKLDNNGYGNENLLRCTSFSSDEYTNNFTSSSTDSALVSWYNGSKAIHTFANGEDTISLTSTSNLGVGFGGTSVVAKMVLTDKYTLSCEAKCSIAGAKLAMGLSYKKTDGTWVWRGGSNAKAFNSANTWQTFTLTFTPDADTANIDYCFTCNAGNNGTLTLRHCKLEKGLEATPWQPAIEELGDALSNIVDSSGYNNDATLNNTANSNESSGRYSSATYFGVYNTPVATLKDTSILPVLTNCTVTYWAKYDTTKSLLLTGQSGSYYLMASNNNNYYHGNAGTITTYKDGVSGTYKCAADGWHFFAITGVNLSAWTALKINGYSSGWPLNGYISDLRIYATQLLDTDIKSLYNTSVKIDNKQNIHAFELVEGQSKTSITKKGQLQATEFNETDMVHFNKTNIVEAAEFIEM